jgi:PAS domain S-box-containing protein
MRIRTKLQIAFITTASIVAVSILSISYFSMVAHFEQQEGKRLKSNVSHSAKVIDNFMFNRVADFNVLSNNPLFSTSSDEIVSEYLTRVVNQYPFYENLFYVNKNGIVISSSDQKFIGANIVQLEPDIEEEFNKTISGGHEDVYISDVSKVSQKEIEENSPLDLELLSDVIDLKGNVVGVLVGFVNIKILNDLIFDIDDKIFVNENIYLVNDKGIVLMSENKEIEILKQHPDLFINDLQQKVENGENGFYIYKNSKDIKVISGYADLAEYGAEGVGNWSLLSATPYTEVMQPIYNMIYRAFFIFLLIISVLLVLIVVFSGTFSKPIVELEQAVSNFGIYGKPLNLKSTHKDEIGSLYKSFNTMTENLYELSKKRNSAEHKLIEAREKAEESENHLRTILETEPECIKQLDAKGELIYMNPAGLAMIEADNLDMVKGQPIIGLITPNHQRAFKKLANEVFKGNSGQLKFEIKGLKGTTKWLETHAVPLKDTEGNIISLLGVTRDITEHKKAEEQIIKSKNYLNNILNNIGDPVFVKDEQSRIVLVNDAFCSSYNITKTDIIGKTMAENIPPEEMEIFFSKDKEVLSTGIENVNEEALTIKNHVTRIISTKKSRYIDDSGHKFLIGVIRDITESKKGEEEIKVANERFEMISRATNDIVWDWNLITNKVGWNDKYYSHFGYPKKEALLDVDSWYDGLHLEDKERVLKGIHHAIEKKEQTWSDEYRFLKADGTPVFVLDRGYILYDNNNKPFRMVGAMLDITDRKKVESELEDHRNNLEELVEIRTTDLEKEKVKAQSADLMKSAFLATMSHELRTPMNSIIGFTGIILKEFAGPINAEQKKQLSMVLNSSQHLLGLINDVLDISKIEAGELKVSLYPFNYVSTLKKTIEFLMPQASKKELVITSEIADRIITLKSDERRVEQVLLNLLSNAIKFSTNGTIQVKVVIIDNLVVTQVIDQGIGISKKDLNSLFIPFIQIETGLNRSHEGSGLGLSICKSLIEKLGGTINVLSIKGEGSNFTFTLPLDYDDKV